VLYYFSHMTIRTLLILGALCGALHAEGKANHDWAEKAAQNYEQKAATAEAAGKGEEAKIYTKMAAIKRAAGEANRNGESFSWDEYHKLEGELNALKGHGKKCSGAKCDKSAKEKKM